MTFSDRTDLQDGLVVKGVGFRYPRSQSDVLTDVSFAVRPGQILGVLGANGSGKTTLMSALLGARAGSRRGNVWFSGSEHRSPGLLGYAPQQVSLYRQLTVRENLRHAARLTMGATAVRQAVDAAIDEFGLRPVADARAHRLSGGWQRLVHIAASFVHRPLIRLLDEPTVALDMATRAALVDRVRGWSARGSAVLLTSHYPEDIEELCSDVLLLDEGRVLGQVAVSDLCASTPRWWLTGGERGRRREVSVDAPSTIGEVAARLAELVDAGGFAASEPVAGIGSSGRSVRGVLAADPSLRAVLRDG